MDHNGLQRFYPIESKLKKNFTGISLDPVSIQISLGYFSASSSILLPNFGLNYK